MRICLLTHSMPRFKNDTNSASFISELAQGLVQENHEVIILTPFDPLFKNFKRKYKVIPYKYIWPESLHQSGYSRVLKGDKTINPKMYLFSTLMSFFALINLVIVCKKYKIDVVTAHWVIPNGFITYLASFFTGIPYTITIPGSDVYLAGKNLFFKVSTYLACSKASWVISDSRHYLDQLKLLRINPKNTSVVRYGVNTKLLKPSKKNTTKQKLILCMGRFVEKKGFIYAIEAFPNILKKFPNSTLMLIGSGELENKFRQAVKKLKISDHVNFPGPVPYQKRDQYYKLADVFIMPSIKDSMGNIDASPVAMMDAMSCGVPVVATKYSGSPDLVDGKSGILVREKNAKQISDGVIKILKNKNQKLVRSYVRDIALSNFSLKKTAQNYISIFKQII